LPGISKFPGRVGVAWQNVSLAARAGSYPVLFQSQRYRDNRPIRIWYAEDAPSPGSIRRIMDPDLRTIWLFL